MKCFFKLSEICIAATAFVIMIKSGIYLRLDSIHEDGIFFLFKVDNSRLTTNNLIQNDLLATAVLLTVAVAAMLAVADTATAILLGVAVTATTTFVMLAVGTAKCILSYLRYV